jgi:hypothetical protein
MVHGVTGSWAAPTSYTNGLQEHSEKPVEERKIEMVIDEIRNCEHIHLLMQAQKTYGTTDLEAQGGDGDGKAATRLGTILWWAHLMLFTGFLGFLFYVNSIPEHFGVSELAMLYYLAILWFNGLFLSFVDYRRFGSLYQT